MLRCSFQAAGPGTGRASLGKMRTHRILTDKLTGFGASPSSMPNCRSCRCLRSKAGRRRRISKVPWIGCGRAFDRGYPTFF